MQPGDRARVDDAALRYGVAVRKRGKIVFGKTAIVLLLPALVVLQTTAAPAAEPEEVIRPGDRLRIVTFNRPEISGEFEVNGHGELAFPFVGRVEASGRRPDELKALIEAALRQDYVADPRLTVELLSRPFYILGDVNEPGEYPYVPGMTVLHAVAKAGGYFVHRPGDLAVALEVGRVREELARAVTGRSTVLAERARLVAERDAADFITFPEELRAKAGDPDVAGLLASEERIFVARKAAFASEIAILRRQIALYEEEINALTGQLAAKEKESGYVGQELAEMRSLVDRKVIDKRRLLPLQQLAAQVEGDRLELAAFIARARQNIGKTETTILDRENDRRTAIMQRLRDTGEELALLEIGRKSALSRLYDADLLLPRSAAPQTLSSGGRAVIVRATADGREEVAATETTLVLPGDIIRIARQALAGAADAGPNAAEPASVAGGAPSD